MRLLRKRGSIEIFVGVLDLRAARDFLARHAKKESTQ